MKKIMVTSIEFKENDGQRSVIMTLTNKSKIVISKNDNGKYGAKKVGGSVLTTAETAEFVVAELVCCACVTYLDGGKKETMSMSEISYAQTLATERFDWAAAGYTVGSGDEEEMQERCITMCNHIAHFEDI